MVACPSELLSPLRAAVQALVGVEFSALEVTDLEAVVAELPALVAAVQAVQVEVVRVFDARGSWSADGSKNAASWLAARSQVPSSAASALVKLAKQLEEMPHTRTAFADGVLSMRQAQVLAGVRDVDGFAGEEAELVAMVVGRPADRTNEIVDQ